MLKLDELCAAMASATQGPFKAELDIFDIEDQGIVANVLDDGVNMLAFLETDCTFAVPPDDKAGSWTPAHEAERAAAWAKARESRPFADAKMIAAVLNAAPVLIEIARAAKAMDDEIKAVENGHRPLTDDVFMRLRAAVSEIS